jgi:hypothetical protein
MDGGAETSASFLQGFVLALLSYPECQKHIQTEIDTVIGSIRLPNFADYEELPYLQAFINEVKCLIILQILYHPGNNIHPNQIHRFRPLMPVAIPHMATENITVR